MIIVYRLHGSRGFYQPGDFDYDAERDCHICPAGEALHTVRQSCQKSDGSIREQAVINVNYNHVAPMRISVGSGRHFYEDAFKASETRLNPEYAIDFVARGKSPIKAWALARFLHAIIVTLW